MFKKKCFLALLVAGVFFMLLYQSRFGRLRLPHFFNDFVNSSTGIVSSVCARVKGFMPGSGIGEEEAERLRAENRALKLREPHMEELLYENKMLREALALKERLPHYVATARVISRGNDRWSNAFVIDKGRADNIEKGMAAVTSGGLLGKVQEAYESSALVLLIDDGKFSAAVRLQDDRSEAVVSGAGSGRMSLKYVESDMVIDVGQVLITSGLDGLFPPGLNVGYVSKITTKADSLFHDIEVRPFVEPRKVEEVVIVRR